jgi:hypothetical protein
MVVEIERGTEIDYLCVALAPNGVHDKVALETMASLFLNEKFYETMDEAKAIKENERALAPFMRPILMSHQTWATNQASVDQNDRCSYSVKSGELQIALVHDLRMLLYRSLRTKGESNLHHESILEAA